MDAVSSASVLPRGNTAMVAQWGREATGGDLFQIIATETNPSNYGEYLDRAADELAQNARPTLTAHVDSMQDYNVVFLGYPNWWATCPMAVFTFLEEYDFPEKTVIPLVPMVQAELAEVSEILQIQSPMLLF